MEGLSAEDQANIATARAAALATAEEAFNKLDLDGNGEVDRQEVQQLASQGVGLPDNADPAQREAKINEFFASFDADGDGKIQKSEWLNFFGSLFDSVIEQGLNQWTAQSLHPSRYYSLGCQVSK